MAATTEGPRNGDERGGGHGRAPSTSVPTPTVAASEVAVPRRVARPWARALGALGLGLVLLIALALPRFATDYHLAFLFMVLFWTAAAQSWNLFSGFTGYVNFGFVGFLGLGAYAMAVLVERAGFHWLLALLGAGGVTALFAGLIGLAVLRVRGAYFAIAMLGLAEGLRVFMALDWVEPLTGGGVGLSLTTGLTLKQQYYAMLAVVVLIAGVTYKIATSRFGLRLLTIREDELAASVMGIPTTAYKWVAFVVSAFFSGLTGGLYAAFTTFLAPGTVFVTAYYTLTPIVMAAFGGLGTVTGPILGALSLATLAELIWARFLFFHLLIFGVVLVFIVLFLPQGVIPWLQERRWLPRVRGL